MTIADNFDNLDLSGPPVHCTYCWQTHYGCRPCGPDAWRYLETSADYAKYIKQYLASGGEHRPLGQSQLRMELPE